MDTAAIRVSLELVQAGRRRTVGSPADARPENLLHRSTTKRRSADRHRPGLILIGNESSPVEQPRPSHSIYRGCQRWRSPENATRMRSAAARRHCSPFQIAASLHAMLVPRLRCREFHIPVRRATRSADRLERSLQ